MVTGYLRRYYRLDLLSCCFFSLFLLYFLIFADNTKSVDLVLVTATWINVLANFFKVLFHLLLLPFLTFKGSSYQLFSFSQSKAGHKNRLTSTFSGSNGGKTLQFISHVLKYKVRDKLRLMSRVLYYLLFLSFVLTTNNSPLYLLNYTWCCLIFVSIYFGTMVHFIYFPDPTTHGNNPLNMANIAGFNLRSEERPGNAKMDADSNYEHPKILYKLFLVQLLLGLFGVCFGNYLLLLDWYQLFARFPITNYVGLTVAHFLSSLAANLVLHFSKGEADRGEFHLSDFLLK